MMGSLRSVDVNVSEYFLRQSFGPFYRLIDEEVLKLGKLPVNGRVIKNILRLATLLTKAHSRKATMEFANIIAVLPLAIGSPKSGSLTDELNQTAEERLEGEDVVAVMNCLASEVSS